MVPTFSVIKNVYHVRFEVYLSVETIEYEEL